MGANAQLSMINPTEMQLLLIGLSLFIIALEVPLAMNLVRPNRLYGFRVEKTLADERIWYAANSYAGRGSILTGVITMVLALGLRPAALSSIAYGLICTLALIVGLILTIILTLIHIKRIS